MTTSVADKTPIPAKVWRQHNDPPGLWFAVAIGSVSLHLLAFWLMRSSNSFGLWFPQQTQSVVPVELIEIAPESKSSAKTTPPKNQQSVPTPTVEVSPQTSINSDSEAVSSTDDFQSESDNNPAQTNTQAFSEPQATTTPTPNSKPEPTPTLSAEAQPTPTIPVGELPWNNRGEIALGKETPLPSDIPPVTPKQIQQSPAIEENTPGDGLASTPAGETANTPSEETSPIPTGETPNTPSGETSPTPQDGGAIAILTSVTDNEARQLANDLPQVMATYQGSSTKTVDSSYLPGDSPLQPATLLASLVIDQNGTFQQAIVLKIEPTSLQAQKSLYEQVISEFFRNENFSPAHDSDGIKPPESNLFVRIKIQSTSQ